MERKKKPSEKFCYDCGKAIRKGAETCPLCGVRQKDTFSRSVGKKDKIVAGILAILLGSFGAHKFYLGETGMGVLYLCFFWTGVPYIIGLIEGIIYLTKSDEEFREIYG